MAGLSVLNRGSVNTCVRRTGGSIVDLTFGSPAVARRVRDWRVVQDEETLSDHLYIRYDVSSSSSTTPSPRRRPRTPAAARWALGSLDKEALVEAAIVQAWLAPPGGPVDVEDEADWLGGALTQTCAAGMARAGPRPERRSVYWWSREIAALRSSCVEARRQYTRRFRRSRRLAGGEVDERLEAVYRERTAALQLLVLTSRERADAELLESLNVDPWGRPYKMVRGKLRPYAPPLTETLEPRILEEVVGTLFPSGVEIDPPEMAPTRERAHQADTPVPPVSEAELEAAVLRLRGKRKAPGPDGIPGSALVLAMGPLGDRFRRLLDACLETGRFPTRWKTGRLVLLRKEGRAPDSPAAYRPIVLLDEVDKLAERVVACRLVKHLGEVGPDLSDRQFGFRVGRSTIDAIKRVKAHSDEVVNRGGVLLAVSLDIANAFNTMPWAVIREALKYHEVPPYLCRIVGDYLSNRFVTCTDSMGRTLRREMSCGVPQGSVLGPLLWNIGYDWVLRGNLPPEAGVFCYADDTLVTASGGTFEEAARLATVAAEEVVGRIERLGLRVALSKTEALCFHGPRRAPPRGSSISIGGVRIGVEPSMKYLGLVLDGRWNFREHFSRLSPRLMGAAAALKRLLPNIGGPRTSCRRLYLGVVRSMALYGAPVWVDALTERTVALLRRSQRVMAVGVIRGYRTVSYEAACLLAGSPPWDLEAELYAARYEWRVALRLHGTFPAPREVERWREQANEALLERWSTRLAHPRAGSWTVEAVRPLLQEWTDRAHGSLTFRLVQVLSGHGCFGKYLHHIAGREPTPACHHCGSDEDTAQHTLEECPAWAGERRTLVAVMGRELSLSNMVRSMLESEMSWSAAVSFCEIVISQKESAERDREVTTDLPMRARRPGRRRRIFHALLRPP